MRMKGVTQSYNMFDTLLYKKANKMKEQILKENAGFNMGRSSLGNMTFDHDQSMVNMPLNLLSVNQSVDDANGQKEMELVSMNDDSASHG